MGMSTTKWEMLMVEVVEKRPLIAGLVEVEVEAASLAASVSSVL
jgi:hypothetical protein